MCLLWKMQVKIRGASWFVIFFLARKIISHIFPSPTAVSFSYLCFLSCLPWTFSSPSFNNTVSLFHSPRVLVLIPNLNLRKIDFWTGQKISGMSRMQAEAALRFHKTNFDSLRNWIFFTLCLAGLPVWQQQQEQQSQQRLLDPRPRHNRWGSAFPVGDRAMIEENATSSSSNIISGEVASIDLDLDGTGSDGDLGDLGTGSELNFTGGDHGAEGLQNCSSPLDNVDFSDPRVVGSLVPLGFVCLMVIFGNMMVIGKHRKAPTATSLFKENWHILLENLENIPYISWYGEKAFNFKQRRTLTVSRLFEA